ncbi:hypothetical protein PNEG_01325 [Pneumocystis murina B123]|uniref:Dolichol-phosphate mannosyltransferase subunit 3 n=1 Tax=Pneumocystis murina (strain B123) TaxID=1069680 RepID=M7NTL2_PNEMU|nr:hypothetical protein PNEG_01325 [Pneumocystis murina B123]EMR10622.1 hypothetical protein PNEG_01325 [Pneumocystis murina B123]
MANLSKPLNSLKHGKLNKIYWGLAFFIISLASWATGRISELITWFFIILFWLLVSIVSFLFGYLGFQLMLFNDKQEAYEIILKDIKEATDWLRQHGIDVET